MLATDGPVVGRRPKKQTLAAVLQNCEKSVVKYFIQKLMLLNFVNLSTIFHPRLSEETHISNLVQISWKLHF